MVKFSDAIDRFTIAAVTVAAAAATAATSEHGRERRSFEEHMGLHLGLLINQLKSVPARRRFRDQLKQLVYDVEDEIGREMGVDNSDAHIQSVPNQCPN